MKNMLVGRWKWNWLKVMWMQQTTRWLQISKSTAPYKRWAFKFGDKWSNCRFNVVKFDSCRALRTIRQWRYTVHWAEDKTFFIYSKQCHIFIIKQGMTDSDLKFINKTCIPWFYQDSRSFNLNLIYLCSTNFIELIWNISYTSSAKILCI